MRDIETSSELLDIKRKVRELEARVKAAEELLEASGQLIRDAVKALTSVVGAERTERAHRAHSILMSSGLPTTEESP